MLHVHNLSDSNILSNSIITIGNYDGVHLGHQHIISKMVNMSNLTKHPTVLLTFTPHTSEVILKKTANLLTSFDFKKKIIGKKRFRLFMCC